MTTILIQMTTLLGFPIGQLKILDLGTRDILLTRDIMHSCSIHLYPNMQKDTARVPFSTGVSSLFYDKFSYQILCFNSFPDPSLILLSLIIQSSIFND